jgi:HEAT repeat protein
MKRAFATAVLLSVLGLPASAAEPPQPARLARLIKQLGDEESEKREAAHRALIEIGEGAEKALRAARGSKDAEVKHRAGQLLKRIENERKYSAALASPKLKTRIRAAASLLREAEGSRKGLAVLTRDLLEHKDPAHRTKAGYELLMARATKSMVPLLIRVMDDRASRAPYYVSRALCILGHDAVEALPKLIERVSDLDGGARAYSNLAKVGVGSRKQLPALKTLMKHRSARIRAFAAEMVWRITGEKPMTVPVVLEALRAQDYRNRSRGVMILRTMRPEPKDALPTLMLLLKNQDRLVLYYTAELLEDFGPAAKSAVPALEKLLNHRHLSVRWRAGYSLAGITGKKDKLVAVLTGDLSGQLYFDHAAAARKLGELGKHARSAIPKLEKLLKDKNEHVRKAAAKALKRIKGSL